MERRFVMFRVNWFVFLLIMLSGLIIIAFKDLRYYDSIWSVFERRQGYYSRFGIEILIAVYLIYSTYSKSFFFVSSSVALLATKFFLLINFYLLDDYKKYSNIYNYYLIEMFKFNSVFVFKSIGVVLFGNNFISFIFMSIVYTYGIIKFCSLYSFKSL